jgi:hypothetical protein
MEDQLKDRIAQLLKQAIQEQIALPRPALTYNGQPKPVNPFYQRPLPTSRINTGGLYNSVNVYWEGDLEDGESNLVVDFGAADYWEFVFYGRRPSVRYPPLDIIKGWTQSKPLPRFRDRLGRFITNDSRAFLVARSIKEYGYYGIIQGRTFTQFIEPLLPRILPDAGEIAKNFILDILKNERIIFRTDSNRPV